MNDELRQLLKDVQELTQDVQELTIDVRSFMAAQKEICRASACQREEHHRVLFGNGASGVKTRLERLETRVETAWNGVALLAPTVIALVGEAVWRYLRR